jgi:membrane-bound metal-dependent hydrolase YbcI (DUF457 family)
MQSPGHLGVALLLAAPAWLIFDQFKAGLAFSGLAALTAMFPDTDLYVMRYVFIEHHGLMHSLVFLIPAALLLGAVVAGAYLAVRDGDQPSATAVYAFVTVALFTGMLAHMAGDVLTSPDVAPPIKPLYPIVESRFVLDAAFVKSNLWNLGPLALGIVVQTGLGLREYFNR